MACPDAERIANEFLSTGGARRKACSAARSRPLHPLYPQVGDKAVDWPTVRSTPHSQGAHKATHRGNGQVVGAWAPTP